MAQDSEFDKHMREKGFFIFNSLIEEEFLKKLKKEIRKSYEVCRPLQLSNGVAAETSGTAHHFLNLSNTYLEFLEKYCLEEYVARYMEGKFILDTFFANLNTPFTSSYVTQVHRDSRRLPLYLLGEGMPLMMNMLVMVDEFTEENGATYLLQGSHTLKLQPTDNEFYNQSIRIIGKPGTIVLFDSNCFHAAGLNKTVHERIGLSLMFIKPFIKPQFDYPRAIGYENYGKLSEHLKQVIGFNARIPASLEEWYQSPEKRMYRSNQR